MKRTSLVLLGCGLLCAGAAAQSSTQVQTSTSTKTETSVSRDKSGTKASGNTSTSSSTAVGNNSASLASGTTVNAALTRSVDAKKNKQGDQVVARTTQDVKSGGKVVIPKGTKLLGHVTQAKARAKGQSESELSIVFDHALLKGGQEMPLHMTIQALAQAESTASGSLGGDDLSGMAGGSGSASGGGGASRSGGGLLGGATSTVGSTVGGVGNTAGGLGNTVGGTVNSTVNTTTSAAGGVGGVNAGGLLNSSTTGVIGLKGLSLNTAASNATQGSLIVSSTKNVHLDSGTRMLLRAEGQSEN